MPKAIDRTGHKYGMLTVINLSHKDNNYKRHWHCICECGEETIVNGNNLQSGKTISCGCRKRTAQLSHGMARTPEYVAWTNMKTRCKFDIKYTKRGITVCEEWRNNFLQFYADMGDRPTPNHSIDRINNDGNYEPGNCRWATVKEQNSNKGDSRYHTREGITKTLKEWCDYYQLDYQTVYNKVYRGKTIDDALELVISQNTPRKVA